MKSPVLLVSILVFTFLATYTNAQMMKSPEERAKELRQNLNLTNEQTEIVEQIYENADNEFRNRIQGSGNRDQMKTAMNALMNDTDAKVLKILNDEQKVIYDSIIVVRKKQLEQLQKNIDY